MGCPDVQEARSQTLLYTQFQLELANQVAPLGPDGPNGLTGTRGPTPPGAPVAILNIPSIGIRDMVVVEGTDPAKPDGRTRAPARQPTAGPAWRGVDRWPRRATFGAPFSRLDELRPGDVITAITGQGTSIYTVSAAAPSNLIIKDPAPDRMFFADRVLRRHPQLLLPGRCRPYLQRPAEPRDGDVDLRLGTAAGQ